MAKYTPKPWRKYTECNIGSTIAGPSGKKSYDGDEGWRIVASYQACGDFQTYAEEEANAEANGNLICAVHDLLEACKMVASLRDGNAHTNIGEAIDACIAAVAKAEGGSE